jgi:thiosulfate/3-mercaptopyruvate sulfurtransferase
MRSKAISIDIRLEGRLLKKRANSILEKLNIVRLRTKSALVVVCLGLICNAVSFAANGAAHPEMLVSTEWLADHLNDSKVAVLQVGSDRGDYEKQHIPGARFLGAKDFTIGHEGLMVELPSVDKLKQTFEDLGVNDDTRVVIYTTDWYPAAGRAYFTLDYLGHANTALLDGSMSKWKAEGRAVTSDVPQITKGSITPRVNESARALLADAKAASEPGSQTMLVDSRPLKRYRDGHLAGAAHIFWEETVQNSKEPVFLSPDELRKLFESRSVVPGKKLITYCEVGLQASHMYFVAKYLGYDVSMFDGSYYQWHDLENLPLVKGDSPR